MNVFRPGLRDRTGFSEGKKWFVGTTEERLLPRRKKQTYLEKK